MRNRRSKWAEERENTIVVVAERKTAWYILYAHNCTMPSSEYSFGIIFSYKFGTELTISKSIMFFKYTQKIGFFGSSAFFFQAKCAVESLCVSHSKFTCIKGINTVKCSAGVYFQNICRSRFVLCCIFGTLCTVYSEQTAQLSCEEAPISWFSIFTHARIQWKANCNAHMRFQILL